MSIGDFASGKKGRKHWFDRIGLSKWAPQEEGGHCQRLLLPEQELMKAFNGSQPSLFCCVGMSCCRITFFQLNILPVILRWQQKSDNMLGDRDFYYLLDPKSNVKIRWKRTDCPPELACAVRMLSFSACVLVLGFCSVMTSLAKWGSVGPDSVMHLESGSWEICVLCNQPSVKLLVHLVRTGWSSLQGQGRPAYPWSGLLS